MAENTIDRLDIQVQTQAQKANADLDKLVGKLERMSSSLNRLNAGGLKNLASGVDSLGRSVQNMSEVKTTDFTRLAKNIEKLGNINQVGINNTANALRQISSALTASTVSGEALKGLSDLANGISRLGYKSVNNAITNLPLLANSMRQFMQTLSTAPQVSANLIQMTNAMANLASQGSKYNSTIKSIASATNTLTRTHNTAYRSNINFMASLSKLTVGYYILRRAIRSAFEPIEKAMNIGETINLFQTSFKKIGMEAAQDAGMSWGSEAANAYAMNFIDRAQSFNDRITEALSLNPNTIMNYQAVFAQMSNAFGLTNKSVMNLSNSFTMLGLDMASFFNTGVEEAMVKLRAGLAGETEPLRTLGIDITEATLKMTALKYGINGTVSEMSQAAKTQLRWLAIMEQADTAFGDMAKTIDSPANQVRILQQQMENLSRSIGTMFIPVISTVLPYINAFFIALRRVADTIAGAMGYELPDYTSLDIYQDVTGDIGEIGDTADKSTGAVNKLKKALASFDQLNILSEGKSKGINIGSGGYAELDDAIAKKTESYMEKFNDELGNMKNKAEELANKIEPKIKAFVQFVKDLSPLLAGAAASMGAVAIVKFFTGLGGIIAKLANTPGLPVALAIGGIVAIYLAVKEYNKKLMQEDLAGRFGKIALSLQEIEEIADALTTSKYTANIDIYVTEKAKLSELEKSIQDDIATLNKLNWKVSVGLGLTPTEIEQYKSTIEKFISDSEAYLIQKQYVVNLAIDAVITDSQSFNDEMSALVDEYFNGSRAEMEQLGKDLRAEMDKAIADGIIDANEQATINNLIKEIAEINSQIADAEFKAKLQTITIDGDLTPDSFKKLTEKIQSTIQDRVGKAEEASYTVLASVNAAYSMKMKNATTPTEKKKIQTEWDSAVKEITKELSKTKAEISFDGTQFSLDSLFSKYGVEMDKVSLSIQEKTKTTFTKEVNAGILNADPSSGIKTLVTGMEWNYLTALDESGMSKATSDGLKEMLAGLEPSEAQYKKIHDDALKAGSQVPEGISEQLTSIETLKALTGDRDAILYLIGQQMAESPEYIKMIASGKLVGSELDNSLIAGMKSRIPDLKLAGDKLITETDGAIKKASKNSADNNISGYVGGMIVVAKKAFEKDTTTKAAVKTWLDGISDTVRTYQLPTMEVNIGVNTSALEAFRKGTQAAGITIQGRASGGYVNTGELFAARENGIPEMVGRIGNRTAVANNDQITGGIASAVKGAMIEVFVPMIQSMNGSKGNTVVEVPLYLDGEELARGIYNGRQSYENRMNPVRVGG